MNEQQKSVNTFRKSIRKIAIDYLLPGLLGGVFYSICLHILENFTGERTVALRIISVIIGGIVGAVLYHVILAVVNAVKRKRREQKEHDNLMK